MSFVILNRTFTLSMLGGTEEANQQITSANQWTGFYMIGTSLMKESRSEQV